jgi:PST family polysaccharide transporter
MAKQVVKNIGFLGLSQAANYLLPLVTIPYITRAVGPQNYGLLELATTVMLYFSAVVIYGFSYTATRKIAAFPTRAKRVARVFSTVLYTRLFLFGVIALVFALLLFTVPKFQEYQKLFLFAFPIVLGWALYPEFLFQGLQKFSVVALANLGIKILAAALIFLLLHKAEDFYFVAAINAFAQIVVALATLAYAFKLYPNLKLHKPSFRLVRAYLKNGWYLFLSHFFTRIYTFGAIIFLGFLLSEQDLGYYAAAAKLIIVGQSFLFLPLGGALFPHYANLFKKDPKQYQVQHGKVVKLMLAGTALASFLLWLLADFLVVLFFGTEYLPVVPYLQIMAPALFLTTISHFAMKQGLMILKKDKTHLYIVIVVGLASLVLNYGLIHFYALWGAALAKLGIELLLALLGWFFYKKAIKNSLT